MDTKDVQSENDGETSKAEDYRFRRLIETFRPGLAIESFLGIFRFKLEGDDLVPPSKLCKFISFVTSTFIVAMFIVFRVFPTAVIGEPYEFDAFKEFPCFVIFCQYWIACLLTTSVYNDSNIKVMTEICHMDTVMHLNVVDDFYKKAHRETIVIFVILMVAHSILDFCDIYSDGILTVSGIMLIIVYFCQDLGLLAFYKLISMLQARLETLNVYLKHVRGEQANNSIISNIEEKNETGKNMKVNRVSIKLNDLAFLYDKIGETCALINDVFNFQIFMILVSAFTYIIVTIWSTLYRVRYDKEEDTGNLTRIVIWSGRCICTVSVLCYICEKLISTRNDTKILVNDIIMDYDQPRQIRLQAKAFMELIEAWTLNISVYDMFFVDITLILKFISVATTYLIVIIQISHFI
ncbi:hypothetical protein EVAR_9494_1 [Eumeta japonica]|uniref:Gustatory receptor n=1 Tax=Eumeta variegata TaxID=151549 RepID=A0A4C1U3G5_EUMVA|nr:hypothetical protein EVAR_9494_1 [Eumeta japonica]